MICHIVFSVYGFWLPNDPRGSWSKYVGSYELYKQGMATKTETRHSVAGAKHDRELRAKQKRALKKEPVKLTATQIESIKRGFEKAANENVCKIHALAITWEHVHMVVEWYGNKTAGQLAGHFKARATRALLSDGLLPKNDKHVWSRGYWKVFLKTRKDLERSIKYVNKHNARPTN